jgi:ABC-type phosphate transport system auxiliary subunit
MGKLKEKYLNNLSEDEMDERFELSAFEYVELMENYKQQSEQLPDEVVEQLIQEQTELEKEFYVQSEIDDINDSMKLKYTDNDILYVLDGLAGPVLTSMIMGKLNDVWNTKNGVE